MSDEPVDPDVEVDEEVAEEAEDAPDGPLAGYLANADQTAREVDFETAALAKSAIFSSTGEGEAAEEARAAEISAEALGEQGPGAAEEAEEEAETV